MRIGFDARISRTWDTGVGRLTVELLRQMRAEHAGDDFLLLKSPEAPSVGPSGTRYQETVLAVRTPSWRQLVLGVDLRGYNLDVVLHTHQLALPLWSGLPAVAMVLDLYPLLFPSQYSTAVKMYFRTVLAASLRSKATVVTISQASRRDIIDQYGIEENRVVAIPLGVSDAFRPSADSTTLRSRLAMLGLEGNYILYVGNQRPHKNLPRLLAAHSLLIAGNPDVPDLVLAGTSEAARSAESRELAQLVTNLGRASRVRILGKVSDDDLVILYNGATLTVVPSLYEGFGLTALEAMASGSPVVASNAGALPEVIGDAGVLVDPTEPAAIAEGILSVLNDADEDQRLRTAGLRRAATFTWAKSAHALYDVLKSAVQ